MKNVIIDKAPARYKIETFTYHLTAAKRYRANTVDVVDGSVQ